MKYNLWVLRRFLSRLFYKKWFVTIIVGGNSLRTAEFDPETQLLFIKRGAVEIVDKLNNHIGGK